jgi:hypothetical protein
MVYIRDSGAEFPEIWLHPEKYEDDLPGKRITLFFHKRLSAYRPESEAGEFLAAGLAEMKELIF